MCYTTYMSCFGNTWTQIWMVRPIYVDFMKVDYGTWNENDDFIIFGRNMPNFLVSTWTADGLTPSDLDSACKRNRNDYE